MRCGRVKLEIALAPIDVFSYVSVRHGRREAAVCKMRIQSSLVEIQLRLSDTKSI